MNFITSRSYRLFTLVIIMVISAIFATLAIIPGLARAQDATFCYSDGCVTLPVGPNGNVAARQATSAASLMSTIDARNVTLYGTSNAQSNSSGNLTSVSCNNGVTASATYNTPAPAATYSPPPPPPPPRPSCSIKFNNNSITAGSSTVMRWSSTNAELFYINGFGYVGASGKATVAPSQSTDYSGYVSDSENGGDAVNCSATLVVRPSACPSGQTLVNGICETPCPAGYIRRVDECVLPVCTAPAHCDGDDIINSCTDALISTCDWGCAEGACKAKPVPSATLKAAPSLVHSGAVTTVSWSAFSVTSCTVRGTNGDSWTGISSAGKTTSPILGQTIYTLHCTGYAGANPAPIDKTVTVNLIPSFDEK